MASLGNYFVVGAKINKMCPNRVWNVLSFIKITSHLHSRGCTEHHRFPEIPRCLVTLVLVWCCLITNHFSEVLCRISEMLLKCCFDKFSSRFPINPSHCCSLCTELCICVMLTKWNTHTHGFYFTLNQPRTSCSSCDCKAFAQKGGGASRVLPSSEPHVSDPL